MALNTAEFNTLNENLTGIGSDQQGGINIMHGIQKMPDEGGYCSDYVSIVNPHMSCSSDVDIYRFEKRASTFIDSINQNGLTCSYNNYASCAAGSVSAYWVSVPQTYNATCIGVYNCVGEILGEGYQLKDIKDDCVTGCDSGCYSACNNGCYNKCDMWNNTCGGCTTCFAA